MADITDPQAIRFVNEKIRPLADTMCRAYRTARDIVAEWKAKGIDKLFPNDGSAIIDGRIAEGVTQLTDKDILAILAVAEEIISLAETNNNAVGDQVLRVAVNP